VPRQPAIRTLDEIARLHGALPVPRALPLRRAFPRAARALGADALCALTAISALVGMECPGRESLLSAVRVRIARGVRPGCIRWRVAHVDRRFGLVRIEIAGDGISGSVEAFVRPQPAAPPSMAAAARGIDPQEFAGQRALIVGGSRGLGAAAALLIAAGGGVPIVTYASNEAAALRRDARAAGRALDIVRLDVTAPKTAARIGKIAARHRVTHLYYCATPRIFATRRPPFDSTRFDRFANVYVRAFADVCVAAKRPAETLDVFYPSTVAVADTPAELTEYAAAKAAGESLCRALEQSTDGLRVLVSRLPRVATDQTASIVPAAALDPLEAMRPIVRAMQRRRRTGPR
jgi:NAD(P)-dependent dehydrogenase (short-subunit alcohol dehydrogenase family)